MKLCSLFLFDIIHTIKRNIGMLFLSFALLWLSLLEFVSGAETCKSCKYVTNTYGERFRRVRSLQVHQYICLTDYRCYDSCKTTFESAYPVPKCPSPARSNAKFLRSAKPTKSSSVLPTNSSTLSITPEATSCTPSSICVDKIDLCYMRYGG